jgi:hypothetical protein
MRFLVSALAVGMAGLAASQGMAGVCEYKPSAWIGQSGSTAVVTATGGTAITGMAAQAAGFYTLVHATSGLTMVGSTLAGSSAAGTIGIIGGTGGAVGTAAATVMSGPVIVVTAVAAVGLSGFEVGCLFTVERVTDYDNVLAFMQEVANHADPDLFRIGTMVDGRAAIIISDGSERASYPVEELYIADGVLKHRDWFLNTTIAEVAWVQPVPEQ